MKFNNKKFDWKNNQHEQREEELNVQMRKEKKERREKYKVKNQKVHQLGWDPNDEYGGMF